MDMFDDDEPDFDEYSYQFELLNSDDGLTITLVCSSSRPLTPDEYGEAVRSFMKKLDIMAEMDDASGQTIN